MPRIFISHSSRDNDAAQALIGWLKDNGFDEVFLDFDRHHGIPPGDEWEKRLYGEIQRASAVTLLLTKNWFESKWCFAEFTQARALGKSMLPIVVTPDGNQFIGDNLQKISLIPDRDEGLSRLLDRLNDIAMEGPAGFRLANGRAPYPGLLSFDREDAAVYFGRGPEVRETLEQLERLRRRGGAKMLYVHGESGAGKSSLLKAGVLPHLERRAHDWIILPTFRPGAQPIGELRAALRTALPGAGAELIDVLLSEPTAAAAATLMDALHHAAGEFQSSVLLSIDQFEEVLILATDDEQQKFLLALSALLDPSLKTLAIATIRTAELPQVEAKASIASEQRLLGPFPLDRIPEIVRRPAQAVGVDVEDGLVAALVSDAQTSESLPLVAFSLRRLYDRHADDYKLTRGDYEALGDVRAGLRPLETCVRDAAAEAIQRVRPTAEEEASLRETFVPGLVRINDRNQFVRRSLALGEIPHQAQRLVDALVNERLLVRRDGSVEVAHEAFFRVWPPLAGWLEEEREFLVGLTRLDAAVADWQPAEAAKRNDALLTGVLLRRCEAWLAQFPQRFSIEQRSLIEASTAARRAAADRKRRLQRTIVASSLAAALLFGILGWVAWQQRDNAQTATTAARKQTYFAGISLARSRMEQGRVAEVRRILGDLPVEHRHWEWGYYLAQSDTSRVILRGHDLWVNSVAISPDGTKIVTSSGDRTARVWDLASGRETAILRGHKHYVKDAKFSPDGTRIITVSDDHTARVWDVGAGRQVAVLGGLKIVTEEESRAVRSAPVTPDEFAELEASQRVITSAEFSPDSTRVLTTSGEVDLRMWDAASGRELAVFSGHDEAVNSARFNHDGSLIVTSSGDDTARIWNAENGGELAVLRGHQGDVRSAEFSYDGKRILTSSNDDTARIWDVGTGVQLAVLTIPQGNVGRSKFSADGTRIVSWSDLDDTARVWDSSTGSEVAVMRGHSEHISSAEFSRDGARVVTASDDCTARIWDSGTGNELAVLRGHEGGVTSVRITSNAQVVTSSWDGTARVWDVARAFDSGSSLEHPVGMRIAALSAKFSPNGAWIVTTSEDKQTCRVWDVSSGRQVSSLRGHDSFVISAEFSPDSRRIATTSDDATARVWESANGRELAVCRGHEGPIREIAFSPDGTQIVTASDDNTVRIWSAITGQELALIRGFEQHVHSVAFNPDGNQIATASGNNSARVWNVEGGSEFSTLRGHEGGVFTVEYSPDGRRILTASADKTARIWDTATSRELAVLRGHEAEVWCAEFSPDGTRIVTASWDGTAQVWIAVDGRPIAKLRGHEGEVWSAKFNPDGSRVVTASSDNTARVWDSESGLEVVILPGSTREIGYAAFSPDGSRILTVLGDGTPLQFDSIPYAQRQRGR